MDRIAVGKIGNLAIGIRQDGGTAAGPGQRVGAFAGLHASPSGHDDGIDQAVGLRGRLEVEAVGIVSDSAVIAGLNVDAARLGHGQEAGRIAGRTGQGDRIVRAPGGAVAHGAGGGGAVIAGYRDANGHPRGGCAVIGVEIDDRRVVDRGHGDAEARLVRHEAIGIGCPERDVAHRSQRIIAGVFIGDRA